MKWVGKWKKETLVQLQDYLREAHTMCTHTSLAIKPFPESWPFPGNRQPQIPTFPVNRAEVMSPVTVTSRSLACPRNYPNLSSPPFCHPDQSTLAQAPFSVPCSKTSRGFFPLHDSVSLFCVVSSTFPQ